MHIQDIVTAKINHLRKTIVRPIDASAKNLVRPIAEGVGNKNLFIIRYNTKYKCCKTTSMKPIKLF